MKESRRDLVRELSFDCPFHNGCFVLGPGHDDDLLGLFDCVDPHGDCGFGHEIQSVEGFGSVTSCQSMEIDESSATVDGRWGFVESDMASPSDAEYLYVDAAI